jgi:hypothetical protein
MLEHACFISFPRGTGKDTQFAQHFYDEFLEHLGALNKTLSVFKYDRCEARRRGDDWTKWIQRELCHSACMIAICAPNYFNGSPACVSEFTGMETLIAERAKALGCGENRNWLLGLRLKDRIPMPRLNPYDVCDFLDCCASPEKVRRVHKYRRIVENLAERVHSHWEWLKASQRIDLLGKANICGGFELPSQTPDASDSFPHLGGVT